jgi:DNA-binding response OmpR family regulator
VKILIVEDDRKLARLLCRMLSEEGYAADCCGTGSDALTQAGAGVYDLIILDWMLPDVDGLEVCRQLRRRGERVPILMLTARGEVPERVLGLDAGADDYLVKPFEIDELLARINALLRRSAGWTNWKLGGLEVDRVGRRVRLFGKPLELTAKEFSLLLHLLHKEGRVVTRSELLSQVWGMQFDPESNVVEVHVSRLRDKLAVGASGQPAVKIETVRGQGYRLRAEDVAHE